MVEKSKVKSFSRRTALLLAAGGTIVAAGGRIQAAGTLMKQRVVLLGDSIIDNGAYVGAGEPDVGDQLQALLTNHLVEKRAVDGSVTRDVFDHQCNELKDRDLVIISTGGNDALGYKFQMLETEQSASPRSVLVALWDIREQYRRDFVALLDRVSSGPNRILVCTIYNPAFHSNGMELAEQRAAESALSAFNDVIQQEARVRRMDVLEIRNIFTEHGDYANPIEPSMQGGAKLAAAMARWVANRE